MEKIFTISLGCSKNLTDSEEMLGLLAHKNFELVSSEKNADVILINTCAFIASAREEADKEIRRAARLKAAGRIKKIIVAGCLTQKEGAVLPRKYPSVDAFIGLGEIGKIDQIIKTPAHCFNPAPRVLKSPKYKMRLTAPHSAYLKVADGCGNCCAYCTIPSIRGGYRSKQVKDVVAEARALAASGVKEISLIAQDTTAYGQDIFGKPSLVKLLRELVKIKSVKWWRVMYAYPETVTEDLLKFIAKHKTVARYIDMPLQHISDGILKAMNRRSGAEEIKQKIAMIRKIAPDMALRTNFIAGFPGETAADFEELKKFIAETKFNNVGIFVYSKEDGTAAAVMKNQIPQKIKQARAAALTAVQSRVVDELNKKLTGKTVNVMLDAWDIGRMECDAPDIDGRVRVPSNKKYKPGDIVKAKIISAEGYIRTAKILP